MTKSYYSPEPEEFHIGFEYEKEVAYKDDYYINGKEELVKVKALVDESSLYFSVADKEWISKIYKLKDSTTNTRVKYLDAEDIESFEFIYVPHKRAALQIEVHLYELINGYITYKLQVNPTKNNICITMTTRYSNSGEFIKETIFFGDIKNKSELKILLKQIGIQYDRN